jgi:hypoxanthine-DNA glycosylase
LKNFFLRVYKIVAQIPEGKVATYGQIALVLGEPRGARTVGWAMKAAPQQLNLPCHRVVNKLGQMAPKNVFGLPEIQRTMLEEEGVVFNESGCIDIKKCLWIGPGKNEINSLSPIIDEYAHILILGSIPGQESLRKQQYYGNPRNHFWKIVFNLIGLPLPEEYSQRVTLIKKHGIALWDVIESCSRHGSLDSNIKNENPNDFSWLFSEYPSISSVCFNGAKAYEVFKKKIGFEKFDCINFKKLPSTSPANTQAYDKKLEEWKKIL